ncbi:hypothetical protein KAR91_38545, partial [Candidatus Pacearchaeota archaeon]|nr:hypothetical protein [Candidatus Pacearchaeota archaeon]
MNEKDKGKPARLTVSKESIPSSAGKSEKKQEVREGKKRTGCLKYIFLFLLVALIAGAGLKIFSVINYQLAVPISGNIILKSSSYTGTANDENAVFTMKLNYETFARFGWVKIPILPVSVAVSEVTLNGKPVYLYAGSQWYEIITKHKGKGIIEAKFSMKVHEKEGVRRLSFDVPRTTATSAVIEIKGEELEVDVVNSQHKELVAQGEKTILKATYPPINRIDLVWKRARPELEEKDARLYSETNTVCSILEGLLHCNTVARYSILRSWINGLKLSIPKDVNILSVTGDRIRDWKTIEISGRRMLEVEFSYKIKGNYKLNIVYEKPIKLDGSILTIPVVHSLGVEREKGFIGIETLTDVEVATDKADGIVAIDINELPVLLKTMTAQPLILGYKYVEQPYSLSLNVKRHEDMSVLSLIADSALHTIMMTSDGRRLTRVFYSIRNNGNQFMPLSLPEGSELWSASIAGKSIKVMQGKKGELLIPLMDATRGSGYVGVEVIYAEDGTKPDLRGRGSAAIQLPTLSDIPVIHLMCELYLPKEGKYRKGDFISDAKMVDQFSSVRTAAAPGMPRVSSEQASRQLQNQATRRFEQKITATGGTPV